ncbi:MAG: hypothetical protein J7L59_01145 [Nanoarchaeota archaeon]|nr:hypothetical protein [Nanoarchaeota archaeon]
MKARFLYYPIILVELLLLFSLVYSLWPKPEVIIIDGEEYVVKKYEGTVAFISTHLFIERNNFFYRVDNFRDFSPSDLEIKDVVVCKGVLESRNGLFCLNLTKVGHNDNYVLPPPKKVSPPLTLSEVGSYLSLSGQTLKNVRYFRNENKNRTAVILEFEGFTAFYLYEDMPFDPVAGTSYDVEGILMDLEQGLGLHVMKIIPSL